MYKRILLPTDGSEASRRAILAGVEFAKELGADVVGLTVTPEFHTLTTNSHMLEDTPEQYAVENRQRAERILDDVRAAARDAGVGCTCEQSVSDDPYEIIIATAVRTGCDLIIMASHGHKGVKALLLGSETQKVLLHSSIPVLVHR